MKQKTKQDQVLLALKLSVKLMREQQRLIIFLPTSSTIPLENEIIMEAAQRSGRRLS